MRVPRLFSILLQIFLAGFDKNGQSDGVKTETASLSVAGLRKYFAGLIRNQRKAIRCFPATSAVALIRKEAMQAKLEQTRFIARDIAFFSQNPESLA